MLRSPLAFQTSDASILAIKASARALLAGKVSLWRECGCGAFELRKKLFPRILAAVLIVEDRSRRVKMGIPAVPFRTLWIGLSKHCSPLLPVVARHA